MRLASSYTWSFCLAIEAVKPLPVCVTLLSSHEGEWSPLESEKSPDAITYISKVKIG